MVTLSFWFKQVTINKIKKYWIDLIPSLGFERVGKKKGGGTWDYIQLNSTPVFFGVSERIEKHTVVDIFARQGEMIPHLEVALKRFYERGHISSPSESFLVNGVEESSGPLLTLWKDNPDKVFEQVAMNFTPQIRVVNVSSCRNITNLRQLAETYAVDTKVIRDNLWLDFGWSQFSDSWDNGFFHC